MRNPNRKIIVIIGIAAVLIVAATIPLYLLKSSSSSLPAGCVKPPGGFLIIASNLGFNDSELHYGEGSWPIINVTKGSTVNITVCDTANYAHGFQISNYYQGSVVTIGPGQVLHVPPFVASSAGNFLIYCSIPCPIHIYMQYGRLSVTP